MSTKRWLQLFLLLACAIFLAGFVMTALHVIAFDWAGSEFGWSHIEMQYAWIASIIGLAISLAVTIGAMPKSSSLLMAIIVTFFTIICLLVTPILMRLL